MTLYDIVHGAGQILHYAAKLHVDLTCRPEEFLKDVEKIKAVADGLYNLPRVEKLKLAVDVAVDLLAQHGMTTAFSLGVGKLAKTLKEVEATAKAISELEPIANDAAKLAEIKNIEQTAANELKLIELLEKSSAARVTDIAKGRTFC
jgi:hypothetical protein